MFARCWRSAETAIGAVGIIHGVGEHSGRYEYLASELVDQRFAVFSFDARGHGRTDGQRGHIDHYDVALDDIECLIATMADFEPTAPRVLLGQSLGGNFVINLLLRRSPKLLAAVALSPLILPAQPLPAWKQQLGRMMNIVKPRFTMRTGLKPEDLSHDPEAVDRYRNDPLVHDVVSARLGASMLAAGRWCLAHSDRLATPLLLMHGTSDRITSPEASRRFADAAGDLCSLKMWEGMYHELLWESQRDEVIAFLVSWIRDLLAE